MALIRRNTNRTRTAQQNQDGRTRERERSENVFNKVPLTGTGADSGWGYVQGTVFPFTFGVTFLSFILFDLFGRKVPFQISGNFFEHFIVRRLF